MTILEWTLSDYTGMSSLSMARAAAGIKDNKLFAPSDPDDLIRCLDFCDNTGTSPEVMRGKSAEWDRLLDMWPRLRVSLARELGRSPNKKNSPFSWRKAADAVDGGARLTYNMMKEALKEP